jgi:hypothetical protein
METNPVFNSDEQLLAVLAMLEKCRSALAEGGNRETAHLVSVAALDLKMKLNRVSEDELKLLCDAIMTKGFAEETAQAASREMKSSAVPAQRLLRLVK